VTPTLQCPTLSSNRTTEVAPIPLRCLKIIPWEEWTAIPELATPWDATNLHYCPTSSSSLALKPRQLSPSLSAISNNNTLVVKSALLTSRAATGILSRLEALADSRTVAETNEVLVAHATKTAETDLPLEATNSIAIVLT